MADKLFSPLKVGALELQHRLVRECVRNGPAFDLRVGPAVELSIGPWDKGGLLIYDPKVALKPVDRFLRRRLAAQQVPKQWCRLTDAAHAVDQKIVFRLSGVVEAKPAPADFVRTIVPERWISAYRFAAERALRLDFDGIELDGSLGTITDLLLNPETNRRANRYGGPLDQRLNFLDELVEALTDTCGGDRVGVRLAPFSMQCAAGEVLATFIAALQILRDREVAYVHLTDAPPLRSDHSTPAPMPVGADLLRLAYPGTLVASGGHTLASAIELTKSRWADAICFPIWPPARGRIVRKADRR